MTDNPGGGADNKVLQDLVLSTSVETATMNVPIESVDISDWLKNLPDKEYQRCAPPDHKAAGYTVTDDGRPMSINVEMIGSGLVIQHYVYEIDEPTQCHMVSLSDVLTPHGWTTSQVNWTLQVEAIDENTTRYTNTVVSHPTSDFMDFLAQSGQSFEAAAAARQEASGDHCARETPLYAASIERHARARSDRNT